MNIKPIEFYYRNTQGTLTEVEPEFFQFPGGEWQMKPLGIPDDLAEAQAVSRSTDPNDLIKIVLFGSFFDMQARATNGLHPVTTLFVPYLPAARSDKGLEAAVGAYTRLLTAGEFTYYKAIDVHSIAARNAGGRVIEDVGITNFLVAVAAMSGTQYDGVIAPDAGARGRASVAARYLGAPLYTAEKKRNQDTGEILSYKVPELPEGGRYLVVDDICDGGATFIHLAQGIADSNEQLDLMVTHGIFSKGTEVILNNYDQVFTTDSVATPKEGVTVFPVLPLMRLGR